MKSYIIIYTSDNVDDVDGVINNNDKSNNINVEKENYIYNVS